MATIKRDIKERTTIMISDVYNFPSYFLLITFVLQVLLHI